MKTTRTARKRAVEPPLNSGETKPRRPGKAAPGPLYRKTDITPDDLFNALGDLPRLRDEAAAEIERLIDFLDMADRLCANDTEVDECDLEDGADAEADDCELEDDQCDEPSLGSLACVAVLGGQEHWAAGNGAVDAEDEHDGSEPSLCGMTAECWGSDRDLEESIETGDLDSGIGDFDGLMEQWPAGFAHRETRVVA